MAGVHVAPALNDENSTLQQHMMGGSTTALKPTAAAAAPLPVAASKQGAASMLKSARKAFGNITNTTTTGGVQPSAAMPSAAKPSASKQQPLQPRRALGDITNSAAKPQHQQHGGGGGVKKQQGGGSSSSSAAPQQAAVAAAAAATSAAASVKWAADLEPERPAGKTWEQLEAERWAAMDAEADASASRILAGMPRLAPPLTGLLAALHTDDDDDDLRALAQPLPRRLQPAWGDSHPAAAQQLAQEADLSLDDLLALPTSGSDLASLLPDIAMPTPPCTPAAAVASHDSSSSPAHGGVPCADAAEEQLLRSPDPTPW